MDKQRRKELVEQYKEIKIYRGVMQITNSKNAKRFIKGYPDLKNKWTSIIAQLVAGRFACLALQADWTAQCPEDFSFEVLEQRPNDEVQDVRFAVRQMEKKWLQKERPYGAAGYNLEKE